MILSRWLLLIAMLFSLSWAGSSQAATKLTPTGHAALRKYVAALQKLLAFNTVPSGKSPTNWIPAIVALAK